MSNTIHTADAVKLAWGYKDLTDMMDNRMVHIQDVSYVEMVKRFDSLQKRTGVVLANEGYMKDAYTKALDKDRKRANVARKVFMKGA